MLTAEDKLVDRSVSGGGMLVPPQHNFSLTHVWQEGFLVCPNGASKNKNINAHVIFVFSSI